jgi:hypothetical protein
MPSGIPPGPWRSALRLGPAAALVIFVAGCSKGDPLDSPVKAPDETTFNMWRADENGALPPEQLGDIDKAVQEIRFQVIAEGKASGSEAVEAATLQEIDGMTVRKVLQRGLGLELTRAEAERSMLEESLKVNEQIRTRDIYTKTADDLTKLTDQRDRQLPRLQAATEEVERTKRKIAALTPTAAPSP